MRAVDSLGNLLAVVVQVANKSDTGVGSHALAKALQKHKTIRAFSGDQGYQRTAAEWLKNKSG